MLNGEFLSKNTEETWEYLDALVENSPTWKTKDTSERSQAIVAPIVRDKLIKLFEVEDIMARLVTLAKKVDELHIKRPESKILEEVQEVCTFC